MKIKTFFFALALCSLSSLLAHETKTLSIHFKVNEHVLDKEDMQLLNELVSGLGKSTYYEMTLSAHTDHDAGDAYNMALSNRRANAVSAYLVKNGINWKRITSTWHGERKSQSVNRAESGKAFNRRVDIQVRIYQFKSAADILHAVSENYKQVFTIDSRKPSVIKGANGMVVNIPANALLTADGKPVNSDHVTITLEEYYNPGDFVYKQLSTVCDGKMIETGGMFTIGASLDAQELKLKAGNSMDVEMPSKNIQKDMELFTSVINSQGITEWKATSQPFRAEPKKKRETPYRA